MLKAEVKAYLANLERGKKRKSHTEEDVEEGNEGNELEDQPRKLPRTDSDTSCVVDLGDMNFLMVRVFKGRKLIDVRSHYEVSMLRVKQILKPNKTLGTYSFQSAASSPLLEARSWF